MQKELQILISLTTKGRMTVVSLETIVDLQITMSTLSVKKTATVPSMISSLAMMVLSVLVKGLYTIH